MSTLLERTQLDQLPLDRVQSSNSDFVAGHEVILKQFIRSRVTGKRCGLVLGYIEEGIGYIGWSLCRVRPAKSATMLLPDRYNEDRAIHIAWTTSKPIGDALINDTQFPHSIRVAVSDMVKRVFGKIVDQCIPTSIKARRRVKN